jgi:hypothetical protein
MLYRCHARFISLSQLLPVLDAHFVYIRSLSLPLESAVASSIQFLTHKFDRLYGGALQAASANGRDQIIKRLKSALQC